MTRVEIKARRLVLAAALVAVPPLASIVTVYAGSSVADSAPHAIAQDECGSSDTMDSYSLQCVPNMVPDVGSDQLTESEVAEPGFNASPGGPGGGGGGGHR